MSDYPTTGDSLVKFGEVFIRILTANGRLPDWTIPQNIVVRNYPGGNLISVQVTGNGPARVTWRVRLDERDALDTLHSYRGTQQTLQIYANTQSLRGSEHTIDGRVYERLAGVFLLDVANTEIEPNGITECDLTFMRSVNLATLEAS